MAKKKSSKDEYGSMSIMSFVTKKKVDKEMGKTDDSDFESDKEIKKEKEKEKEKEKDKRNSIDGSKSKSHIPSSPSVKKEHKDKESKGHSSSSSSSTSSSTSSKQILKKRKEMEDDEDEDDNNHHKDKKKQQQHKKGNGESKKSSSSSKHFDDDDIFQDDDDNHGDDDKENRSSSTLQKLKKAKIDEHQVKKKPSTPTSTQTLSDSSQSLREKQQRKQQHANNNKTKSPASTPTKQKSNGSSGNIHQSPIKMESLSSLSVKSEKGNGNDSSSKNYQQSPSKNQPQSPSKSNSISHFFSPSKQQQPKTTQPQQQQPIVPPAFKKEKKNMLDEYPDEDMNNDDDEDPIVDSEQERELEKEKEREREELDKRSKESFMIRKKMMMEQERAEREKIEREREKDREKIEKEREREKEAVDKKEREEREREKEAKEREAKRLQQAAAAATAEKKERELEKQRQQTAAAAAAEEKKEKEEKEKARELTASAEKKKKSDARRISLSSSREEIDSTDDEADPISRHNTPTKLQKTPPPSQHPSSSVKKTPSTMMSFDESFASKMVNSDAIFDDDDDDFIPAKTNNKKSSTSITAAPMSPKPNKNYDVSKSPSSNNKQLQFQPSTPTSTTKTSPKSKKEPKAVEKEFYDDEDTEEEGQDTRGLRQISQDRLVDSIIHGEVKEEKESSKLKATTTTDTIKNPTTTTSTTPSKTTTSTEPAISKPKFEPAKPAAKGSKKKAAAGKKEPPKERTEEEIREIKRKQRDYLLKGKHGNPPPNKGSKQPPFGAPNCLKGKVFTVTGVLDCFERDEIKNFVLKFGGAFSDNVPKKVTHVVVGEGGGEKKKKIIEERLEEGSIVVLTEDEFLDMINSTLKSLHDKDTDMSDVNSDQMQMDQDTEEDERFKEEVDEDTDMDKKSVTVKQQKESNSSINSSRVSTPPIMKDSESEWSESDRELKSANSPPHPTPAQTKKTISLSLKKTPSNLSSSSAASSSFQSASNMLKNSTSSSDEYVQPQVGSSSASNYVTSHGKPISLPRTTATNSAPPKVDNAYLRAMNQSIQSDLNAVSIPNSFKSIKPGNEMMWVDKYKPTSSDDIIGNNTLVQHLKSFLADFSLPIEKRKYKFNAVLISGPPGIGKTTCATMVLKELGYDILELNASDTRNKAEIDKLLGGVSDNKSITQFFSVNKKATPKRKAIIMDEVDGSSGNSDRGGIKEIIGMIKDSKVPFICICNDYYSTKIKSLKNYCADLRFKRPTASQVQNRLLQIAKHEGMQLNSYMIDKLFASTKNDIRQTIHLMQMLNRGTSTDKSKLNIENIDSKLKSATKDFDNSPFESCETLLKTTGKSINDRLELFFSDHSLIPLMIQENYLTICPRNQKSPLHELELFSLAAESISESDVVSKEIYTNQSFELLPTYAMMSTVIPCHHINGNMTKYPLGFPQYLGKQSNYGKQKRFVSELQLHMRSSETHALANKSETRLYYTPMFRHYMVQPLIRDKTEGIGRVIDFMDEYGLTEDDRNDVIELTTWNQGEDELKDISAPIKTSFTKKWRSGTHAVYDVMAGVSKGSGSNYAITMDFEEAGAQEESTTKIEEDEEAKAEEEEKQEVLDKLIKNNTAEKEEETDKTVTTKKKGYVLTFTKESAPKPSLSATKKKPAKPSASSKKKK